MTVSVYHLLELGRNIGKNYGNQNYLTVASDAFFTLPYFRRSFLASS